MPAQELSHLYGRAVLWPITGMDRYGQPLLGDPVEIACRWDNTNREVLDAQGNRVAVDATAQVGVDITVGSELWFGELNDWIGTGTGQDNDTEVMTVKTFNKTPDIRNRYATRVVGMLKKAATRNANT